MDFRKYDHVERLGHDDVNELTIGEVYVFAKLDGTNASVWLDYSDNPHGPVVRAGSRTRTLSPEKDNAGFDVWVQSEAVTFIELLTVQFPKCYLYGEWLVPHTFKQYREEAWRKFYVFDVYDTTQHRYLHYEEYAEMMQAHELQVIEPMCIYTNPSDEQLQREVENNSYLILDGAGVGEGVVMKNYSWTNKYGRQPWAKIVRNEFKEESRRAFGTTEKNGEFQVECAMAEEFLTQAMVEKTKAKILVTLALEAGLDSWDDDILKGIQEGHRGQVIPRLLGTVFHDFVVEELWGALKKHKFPTVDFKRLRTHVIIQTKKYAPELF